MSYKNREVQPEFFCGIKKKHKPSIFKKNIFGVNYKATISLPYDTFIVIVIAVLMVNLTLFVLGIERGKILARTTSGNEAPKADVRVSTNVPAEPEKNTHTGSEPVQKLPEETVDTEENPPAPETEKRGYIIQLVTYSSNRYAEQELERLKAAGIEGSVIQSGKYFVVYAGVYRSKSAAKEKLSNFKERYKDCFVRFLKNS